MTTDNRHADTFRRGERAGAATKEPQPQPAGKTVDNEAQAAAAEEFRTREYAVGGDDEPAPKGIAAQARRIEDWIRTSSRPSPYGTSHFPPLPPPPGLDSAK